MFTTFLVAFALFGPLSVHGLSAVVVEPIQDNGVEAALIVIPGAELRGESYLPLADAIQRESPLKLWVALTTDYLNDTPNPGQLSRAIDNALDELASTGMTAGTPVFYSGHSLGGTFLQTYIANSPTVAKGMMLWASYLTGSTEDLAAFPTPVMHICGDLDGQVRITTNARPFRQLEELLLEDPTALATKPVVIVEGVNHFQFSSGVPPPAVVRGDLEAEVTFDEAWTLLARVINDFMSFNLDVDKVASYNNLADYHAETLVKLSPLSEAKNLEWDGTESAWIKDAQELVAGLPADLQTPVTIYNVGYTDQGEFESSKPSVVMDSDGMAIIATRSKVEFPVNPIDLSTRDAANEIAGKMKNQEAIQRIVKEDGYGDSATCRGINEAAFAYAYNIAPDIVKSRYDTRGKQMVFLDDVNTSTGSEWVDSHVEYVEQIDGTLEVKSSALYTDVDLRVASYAGMYYCKLMSPYRALEWMYVDSLRPVTTESN